MNRNFRQPHVRERLALSFPDFFRGTPSPPAGRRTLHDLGGSRDTGRDRGADIELMLEFQQGIVLLARPENHDCVADKFRRGHAGF